MASGKIHGRLLRYFMGAGLVDGRVRRAIILGNDFIGQHPGFDFLAADVGQHVAVDFDARAQHLAAFFDHFLPLQRVVDDVAVFIGQVVFAQHGANSLAPATGRFQVSDNLWFGHRLNSFFDTNRVPYFGGGCKHR